MIFKVADLQAQLQESRSSNYQANQQYEQNRLALEANPNLIPGLDLNLFGSFATQVIPEHTPIPSFREAIPHPVQEQAGCSWWPSQTNADEPGPLTFHKDQDRADSTFPPPL